PPPWERDAQSECRTASSVFSEAPHGPLDYRIPDALLESVRAGVRVKVPLGRGNREMPGYCVSVQTLRQPPDAFKPIAEVVDAEPLCTPRLLELFQWISRYYMAPLGQVFEAAIPAGVRLAAGVRTRTMLYPTPMAADASRVAKLTTKQREVLRQ